MKVRVKFCIHCGREMQVTVPWQKFCGEVCSFEFKIDLKGDEECWGWNGEKNTLQSARCSLFRYLRSNKRFKTTAAKFSYELYIGKVPVGMIVYHLCDSVECTNPNHLGLMPDRASQLRDQTIRDKIRRGQGTKKLNETQVKEIRESMISTNELAKKFMLSVGQIDRIKRYASWKRESNK